MPCPLAPRGCRCPGARASMGVDLEVLAGDDRRLVERQLARPLRGEVRVGSRCPYGMVQVIATSPLLEDGSPFPTLFWLTCPLLQRAVSRLENGDMREELRRMLREETGMEEALRQAEEEYSSLQDAWAERAGMLSRFRELFAERRGIGGTVPGGMKCLHAHLAHYLATGSNPLGREVAARLGGLQEEACRGACDPFLGRGR